jgi:hypothetical protein
VYSSWLYKKLVREEMTDEEKKANIKQRKTAKNKLVSFLNVI